jgi:hypothetical protein
MRQLRQLAWTAAIAAATATPAVAQITGGTTSGLGGTTGGTGGLGGGGLGGGGLGGGGGGSGLGGSGVQTGINTGTSFSLPSSPKITAPSAYATSSSGNRAVDASNFLGPTYANPYYQGVRTNAMNANAVPGGFGSTLFTSSGGGTTRGGNVGSALGGNVGGAGGAGGRGGAGTSGQVNTQDPGGVLVPLPVQIAYSAQVRFTAPIVAPQVQADLKGVIDRSGLVSSPAGVLVVVDGNTVILRGAVKDADEARLVEGLARLTPGVGLIRNELNFPGK